MKWKYYLYFAVLLAGILPLSADVAGPLSYQQVVETARSNLASWKKSIPEKSPRLLTSYQDKLARLFQGPWADATEQESAAVFLATLEEARTAEIPAWMNAAEGARKLGVILQDGRQQLWMRPLGGRLTALALAYRAHPSPEIAEAVRALTLALIDYPTWGLSTPNNDLAAAEAAIGVSFAWDAARELFSEAERENITATIRARMRTMYAAALGPLFWADHWRGNHNHICFSSLGLAGLAFFYEIEQAPEWLAAAQLALPRIMQENNSDGSTEEGVYYWSYGLHFILLLLEAQRPFLPSASIYAAPYLKNAIDFRFYTATADFSGFVQFADAFSTDCYGPRHILRRLASEYRRRDGQWAAERMPNPRTTAVQSLMNYLYYDPTLPAEIQSDRLDHHFADWDVGVSRGGWGEGDFVVFLKSGYTNVNHSSLDIGSLAFCLGPEWLLSVPGYGTVGPGFWETQGRRWDYYSKATESHNTLLINGGNQRFDPKARGRITRFASHPQWNVMEMDMTEAYHNARRITRTLVHYRGQYVLVLDAWELNEPGVVEWLAQPQGLSIQGGNPLSLMGEYGGLKIHALVPQQDFQPRAPRSLYLNTGPQHRRTHALHQSGRSGVFIVLLEPIYTGGQSTSWQAAVQPGNKGVFHLEIQCDERKHFFSWHPREGFSRTPVSSGDSWSKVKELSRPRPLPNPIPVFPEVPEDRKIVIQAEHFTTETGGLVVTEAKVQALGQAIRGFGGQGKNHALTWTVPVRAPGRYSIAIRYASNLQPTMDLVFAGRTLPQQLSTTGGWANSPGEWVWHTVHTENKDKAIFDLSVGEFPLRLENAHLAANYDAIVLLREED